MVLKVPKTISLKLKIDYGLFRVLGLKYAIKSPYGSKICIFSLLPFNVRVYQKAPSSEGAQTWQLGPSVEFWCFPPPISPWLLGAVAAVAGNVPSTCDLFARIFVSNFWICFN